MRVRLPIYGLAAPDVHADGRVELQGLPAGSDLRVAVGDPHLLTQLVDKDDGGVGLADHAGQLAQGLRHQPRLQADVRVPHHSVYLGLGDQRGDGVYGDDVDGAASHKRLGDLQRLFSGVRLGHV